MKLMEKMRQKKTGNEGFSLVELIIVIAIMAILLGIVGTQVVPYLNRAREAKDLQVINSFCTAAVTVYSSNADDFAEEESTDSTIYLNVFGTEVPGPTDADDTKLKGYLSDIQELTGYYTATNATSAGDLLYAMTSKKGLTIDDVQIVVDFGTGKITAQAYDGTTPVFEEVVAYIGTVSGN